METSCKYARVSARVNNVDVHSKIHLLDLKETQDRLQRKIQMTSGDWIFQAAPAGVRSFHFQGVNPDCFGEIDAAQSAVNQPRTYPIIPPRCLLDPHPAPFSLFFFSLSLSLSIR